MDRLMTSVPMPRGVKGIKDTPKLKEYLTNLAFMGQYILRTPGTTAKAVSSYLGTRGAATWYVDNMAYFVIGSQLQRLESDGTLTDLGSISGTADCVFSLGQVNLVIIVKGGAGYTYNAASGLTEITDTDFVASDSVDFMNGRHVFIPSDGSPAFYSEVDQGGNINPLNFFDAEELPDLNKFVINISNQLYICGGEATEIFKGTTSSNTPFIRREGSRVDVGYIGGGVRYLGTFAFIGKNRDEGYSIHVMQSGAAPSIANDAINELLNTEYTFGELKSANSFSYQWKGVQLIGWNLTNHTIAFVNGEWINIDSTLDPKVTGPWDGKGVTFAYDKYHVGHRATGQIGTLSDTPGEYGEKVEYELSTFIRAPRDSNFSLRAVEVDLLTGQGGTTIGMSLSRDGGLYSDYIYRSLAETGERNHRVRFAGGLGRYESYCGLKLRGTGNVRLSIESIEANL